MRPRDPKSMPIGHGHAQIIHAKVDKAESRLARIERKINRSRVGTTLPTNPLDGQVLQYQSSTMRDGATNVIGGVVWTFRYNSANTSSYKWEFVGGSAWVSKVDTAETTTSAAYAALATAGPSITVPLAGVYAVSYGSKQDYTVITSNRIAYHSIDIGAAAASDSDAVVSSHPNIVGLLQTPSTTTTLTLAAGDAVVSKYRTGADTVRFQKRFLSVVPVSVG